jgi:hypothetical protein
MCENWTSFSVWAAARLEASAIRRIDLSMKSLMGDLLGIEKGRDHPCPAGFSVSWPGQVDGGYLEGSFKITLNPFFPKFQPRIHSS